MGKEDMYTCTSWPQFGNFRVKSEIGNITIFTLAANQLFKQYHVARWACVS